MKMTVLGFVISSLISLNAAFASESFVERQQGNCYNARQHAEEKALGDCVWAQFTSCQVQSNNLISYPNYDSCEYEAVVVGYNQDKNPNTNRIFKVESAGDCGAAEVNSANGARARCYAAGMNSCEVVQTVTLTDNGQDYCQVYSLARGQK